MQPESWNYDYKCVATFNIEVTAFFRCVAPCKRCCALFYLEISEERRVGRRCNIRIRSKRWKISLFFVVSLDIRQYACDFTPWKVKIFQALLSSKNFFRVNFSQYKEKTQLILSYLRVFWRSNTGNSPKKTGSDIATSAYPNLNGFLVFAVIIERIDNCFSV